MKPSLTSIDTNNFGTPPRNSMQNPIPNAAALLQRRKQERVTPDQHTPRISNGSQRETYRGTELAPYTTRPGALDAFSLPSRSAFTGGKHS